MSVSIRLATGIAVAVASPLPWASRAPLMCGPVRRRIPIFLALGLATPATQALAQAADRPAPGSVTLPPIVIQGTGVPIEDTTAGPVQGYRALTAKSATRTSTPLEQIPQNIVVIPRTVIDSQSNVTLTETLRNVSNLQPMNSLNIGNVEQVPYKLRGFGAELWTDGFGGNLFVAGDRDGLVNVERVEVLKGPNAILYGGGGGAPVGGAINIVSKMPTDKAKYEAGITFGSYMFANPYIDVNQPLDANKNVLFRLTAEYTGSNSYIQVLDTRRFNINPTLTLTNREGTSLTLQGFVSEYHQQSYPGLPVTGTIVGDFQMDRSIFFGNPSIMPSYSKLSGITATFDHRFDETWSVNVKGRWSQSEMLQNSQSPFLDATGTGGTPFIPNSTFDVNNIQMYDAQQEFSINPTIQAKFTAGPTKNTVLIGGDYSRVSEVGIMPVDTLGNVCFIIGFGCTPSTVNLQNPSFPYPYTFPYPGVGESMVLFNYNASYLTKGLYGQIQSTLYDRVHLVGGLRLGSIDITYNEYATGTLVPYVTSATRLLPRAGIVVDLTKGLSVYGSYSQGMKWVPFSQTFAQPAPEYSSTFETGVKVNINDALTGTVALFQIERTNVPVRISAFSANLTQQTSRGFEADLIYQPNRNWSVLVSYGYTDAFFTDPAGTNIPAGNKLPYVPPYTARLWADYKFDESVVPGLSLGAGIYAAGGQYVDPQNQWKTGGYYTIDAKVGYENERVRAAITAKNLTNNQYLVPYSWFGGQVAPGAPLMVYGQLSFKL